MPRPIRATISAAALAHNLAIARRHAGEARIWAVLKANAYGHGLLRAAQALREADGFAMLDFVDALRLRDAGIDKPILMLEGFFKPEDISFLSRYRLTPVIHSIEQIEMLEKAGTQGGLDVYLKVNSGMNRLGFAVDNVRLAWNALKANPGVASVTLMTHFADADGEGGIAAQLQWFNELTRPFDAPDRVPRSLANSAALLRYEDEARADWVRPGIMLYGCSPFTFKTAEDIGLKPAMTLSAEIIGVQHLQAGERVGYGMTYEAAQEMTLGVVSCGYADGYPRHAPSGTPVLVAGRRTATVGRVSMDLLCVDISDIPEAYVGTPVTLWGEGLPCDEVAQAAGTVSYELLCALAPRVPVLEKV
ncbi:MAG: alanine racemase [Candidatus Parcubacteria bacterium]|nr:alanine racemase [Burkholderiales bacterium]